MSRGIRALRANEREAPPNVLEDAYKAQMYLTAAEEKEKDRLIDYYAPVEEYVHAHSTEEDKRLIEFEILDQRLLEKIEHQIDKALALLTGMCMGCASCFNFDEKHVTCFSTFKKAIFNEVAVFKARLLPLAVLIMFRIQLLFNAWLEREFDLFQQKLPLVSAEIAEHRDLVHCLELWFANLVKDMNKWEEHADVVMKRLYLDARRIRDEEFVMRVTAKVDTGVENMFIPLLFVPGINERAARYVHGMPAHQSFKMPPAAHNLEERVVVGTLAMTKTMMPCLGQFRDLMHKIQISLDQLKATVDELHALGESGKETVDPDEPEIKRSNSKQRMEELKSVIPQEDAANPGDPDAPPAGQQQSMGGSWMQLWEYYEQWERPPEELLPPEEPGGPPRRRRLLSSIIYKKSHYHTMVNRCQRIQASCQDIWQQSSILIGDMEEVPFDRHKYAPAWMEESVDPAGVCIKEHVWEATSNVEVISTVD